MGFEPRDWNLSLKGGGRTEEKEKKEEEKKKEEKFPLCVKA